MNQRCWKRLGVAWWPLPHKTWRRTCDVPLLVHFHPNARVMWMRVPAKLAPQTRDHLPHRVATGAVAVAVGAAVQLTLPLVQSPNNVHTGGIPERHPLQPVRHEPRGFGIARRRGSHRRTAASCARSGRTAVLASLGSVCLDARAVAPLRGACGRSGQWHCCGQSMGAHFARPTHAAGTLHAAWLAPCSMARKGGRRCSRGRQLLAAAHSSSPNAGICGLAPRSAKANLPGQAKPTAAELAPGNAG